MYYGMVTQIDANVGRILKELERLGIAADTIVAFTSDHGDLAGSHDLNGKAVSYEESAAIPLLMRGPGITAGTVIDAPIDSSSFLPTCMELAEVPTRQDLAGRSRAGLLRGEEEELPVFADLRDWCLIRLRQYKLTVEGDDCRPTLLFDVEEDPYEQVNLVDSEACEAVVEELRERLCHWREECLRFRMSLPGSGFPAAD